MIRESFRHAQFPHVLLDFLENAWGDVGDDRSSFKALKKRRLRFFVIPFSIIQGSSRMKMFASTTIFKIANCPSRAAN